MCLDRMTAIKALLEALSKQSTDVFGYYHYIEKELVEDATKEFTELQRDLTKRTATRDLSS